MTNWWKFGQVALQPSLIVAALFATVVVACGWLTMKPGHPWGDDAAGYILQAQALNNGAAAQELELNRELMSSSDVRLGPDAYPWGFPALLALVGPVVGWDIDGLKRIELVCLGLVAILVFVLARTSGLCIWSSTAVSGAVCLQPNVLSYVNSVQSDYPFLVLSVLSLVICIRLISRLMSGQSPTMSTIVLAYIGVVAFAFRSNGLVNIAAFISILVILSGPMITRDYSAGARMQLALYVMITVVGTAVYFLALPDGSLMHSSYLTFDPEILTFRIHQHLLALGSFLPMTLLPTAPMTLLVLVLLLVAAVGAIVTKEVGLLLAGYCLGHLGLLTLFNFDGGSRYYFPVLPALAVLVAHGASYLWCLFEKRLPMQSVKLSLFSKWSSAILIAGLLALTGIWIYGNSDEELDGPYSPETIDVVAHIPTNLQERPIGFFKARMYRMLTGQTAIVVNRKESVSRVDILVFVKQMSSDLQLSLAEIQASESFENYYENDQYIVFRNIENNES